MPGASPEGLPFPYATEPTRDGAAAVEALARKAGTALIYPIDILANRIGRVGIMFAPDFPVVFGADGRTTIDVSGAFASVLSVSAMSNAYPMAIAIPEMAPNKILVYAQWLDGAPVVGAAGFRLMIAGVRK